VASPAVRDPEIGTVRSKRKLVGLGLVAAAALFMLVPQGFGRTDRATIARPHLLKPTVSAVWMLPTFAWSAVKRADHYEFQLAADSQFNSPVLGGDGDFTTRNTRATVRKAPPNGRYWYRVRAVMKSGKVSGWAVGSVRKSWRIAPQLVSPADGGTFNYPTDPLILRWKPVPGAAKYSVAISPDPTFATSVAGAPLLTAATSVNPPSSLPLGRYYWRVTPLDPEKNQGATSAAHSFFWHWPSTTTTHVTDLVAAPEFDDPQLSWDPVAGAAHYDLDINTSVDFAPGSRVCCPAMTGTKYSPPKVLDNNTYYWRVRAIDARGNEGDWVRGPDFTKTFDTVPPVAGSSIHNLHLRDNEADPGYPTPTGYATAVPILTWDAVPGASAYEVIVTCTASGSPLKCSSSGACDWSGAANPSDKWDVITGITSWSPLGIQAGHEPYPATGVSIEKDSAGLIPGVEYCVRVRALSDTGPHGRIYGDFTYLGNNGDGFMFTDYGTGGTGTPSIAASDYKLPTSSSPQPSTPLFTWNAIPGAASYWVIVARDPSFTTLIDYGFTQIPAYAPRITYSDETHDTNYYWAVLPSCVRKGDACVPGDPHAVFNPSFNKRSTPPALLPPASGPGATTFHWTPVLGARYYTLQVSADPTFAPASLLDNVNTDSTAYTSNSTYPPDSLLYWRVRASDEGRIGLTWSLTGSFKHSLPAPVLFSSNPTIGEEIPVWLWHTVPGAVAYDLHAVLPDSSTKDIKGLPSPAFVAGLIAGNGFFTWSVRGEFPNAGGLTPGPYSQSQVFTKTLTPPVGLRAIKGSRSLVFAWAAKTAARKYRFQVARNQDFSKRVESTDTESNIYAPLMNQGDYFKGGKFYWRVAGIDDYGNVGKFSKTLVIRLPRRAH
jgi:hypothetical protein